MSEKQYFIGVNLTETHAFAVVVSELGETVTQSTSAFETPKNHTAKTIDKGEAGNICEQSCESWWRAVCNALGHISTQIRGKIDPKNLVGISVSSEPGHIAVVDRSGNSLYPAMMAVDSRAEDQTIRLNGMGQEHVKKVGYPFRPTDALAKIVWIKENEPDIYENAIFVHQADYILGKLKGKMDVTNSSIAITTGCDPEEDCWPDWLDYDMHLSVRERLPQLAKTGQLVGYVTPIVSQNTGLPVGLPVVLGCSSQTASFLASGARNMGDFFTTFGDVMQIDGISQNIIQYSRNIVKMNRLPEHEWFFSTQTNTGTEWINVWFNEQVAKENIGTVERLLPSRYLAYPNVRRGEIFPFNSNSAEGFISPATDNRPVQFAACIQGTALMERLIYQTIDDLTDNSSPGNIYTIGRWCESDVWMQCRSDITGRVLHRLMHSHGAGFGTAFAAAIGTKFGSLQKASDAMVHIERSFYPNPEKSAAYRECYENFLATMEEQGYLLPQPILR
ncbi:MAG: hypothetical protein LBJ67_13375 [Planctomycetaceae bacterium]|jgi:xylulokinase|nr:hypothetical protein [Planctomycetaceae bacterium]